MAVNKALDLWEKDTCIRFVPYQQDVDGISAQRLQFSHHFTSSLGDWGTYVSILYIETTRANHRESRCVADNLYIGITGLYRVHVCDAHVSNTR